MRFIEITHEIENEVIGGRLTDSSILFIRKRGSEEMYPAFDYNLTDAQNEVLENESYYFHKTPLEHTKGTLKEDTAFCKKCSMPMLDIEMKRSGSIPTSPNFKVKFKCPECGNVRMLNRRRE